MQPTEEMLCFSLYAASRAATQTYRNLLGPWSLTYPQYLVLVSLWAQDDRTVSDLGDALHLDSGTLSPLLKRLESTGYVSRDHRSTDERVVTVSLTPRGRELRTEMSGVPHALARAAGVTSEEEVRELISTINRVTASLHAATKQSAVAGQ